MKAVIQRVLSASVTVDGNVVSSIGKGLLVLAAVSPHDSEVEADTLAQKILKLKLWDSEDGKKKWANNVQDISGELLIVSQFTLYAHIKKDHKPDFHHSAPASHALPLYTYFHDKVKSLYTPERVKDGVFGAMMQVALVNDGPVTIEMDVPANSHKAEMEEREKEKEKKELAKKQAEKTPEEIEAAKLKKKMKREEGKKKNADRVKGGNVEAKQEPAAEPEGKKVDVVVPEQSN
ncbi:hypothetical protein BJ508DRAFT_416149 [Ascobolus immersus RN42]|uniref:D-aminoacyl-tRNA deacylase n=1 Tax=Ascobolus immersus RN42 TaxID=1160509 RepID=A0A3N4HYZ0_ASCIM|nr:hypothetical protein BJ508DRAFT_416149 [Ascobolus immersus RN42]